jgi:hypothetical protein
MPRRQACLRQATNTWSLFSLFHLGAPRRIVAYLQVPQNVHQQLFGNSVNEAARFILINASAQAEIGPVICCRFDVPAVDPK